MTPILGAASCDAGQARQWALDKGAPQWWASLTDIYWGVGGTTGVRPDVGFAQACKESGFGYAHTGPDSVLDPSFCNPAGIKTAAGGGNYDPNAHHRFPDWPTGIGDHVRRLWRYATPAHVPTPDGWTSVRPVPVHYWGAAPTVERLSGKWAPSLTYHESVLRYVEEMTAMTDSPGVTIVSRHQWQARQPRGRYAIATPTPELWLHHFASEHHGAEGMRAVQGYHMDTKGWTDIAYSFCVDADGTIFEGRGVGIGGGHTRGRNTVSHAICLMGNYQQRALPRAALQSAAALAAHGIEHGWWKGWTGGHRQAPGASTSCPGDNAMKAWKDLVALTDLYRNTPPATPEDDMHAGEIIASYMEAYGNPTKAQGRDIRTWIHEVYRKPPAERDGAVAYIRNLLGLT